MSKERVAAFVSNVIEFPLSQVIEDVASESHETRRFPDPYVFVIGDDSLHTPLGHSIEEYMEKESYLGEIEYIAFNIIQNWAINNDSGIVVWFSPPYPEVYPVSKIIISEITYSLQGKKSLFNRAVVLDIDSSDLICLADKLSQNQNIQNPELLRARPFFPEEGEFIEWFQNLSAITTQSDLISSGRDTILKQETYREVASIHSEVYALQGNVDYTQLYYESRERDLIGEFQGSCPAPLDNSPFETMFENSLIISEGKTLKCTCPFCNKKVTAIISNGKIHCPSCSKSATYKC